MYLCSILFSKTSFVCTNQGIIKRYFYIFWKFHHNYERKVLAILCWCIFYVYFELVLPELYLKIPFFICRNSRDDIRRKLGFVYFLNFTWVSKWVSEWVSEWVGGWVGEWVSEWVSEVVSEWVSEWVCETSSFFVSFEFWFDCCKSIDSFFCFIFKLTTFTVFCLLQYSLPYS